MAKYLTVLYVFLFFNITGCITVNPYHCPATTDERYRNMDHRDKKHLTRKPNKYKRRQPGYNQQEGLGELFDYKIK